MEDPGKGKGKKGLISKSWERCKSLRKSGSSTSPRPWVAQKSKSWPRGLSQSESVAPEGCLSIYVGPQRERFVIKTEYVNHPLFKTLLEEAESVYGYCSDGPLLLPCQVHRFMEMLAEMEMECQHKRRGWSSFMARNHSSYHLLTPPGPRLMLAVNHQY